MARAPTYTDTLAKNHGGRWTFKHKRWSCDDGRRYVSCTGNLFDKDSAPIYHLYGEGKPRIVPGPVPRDRNPSKVQEPECEAS